MEPTMLQTNSLSGPGDPPPKNTKKHAFLVLSGFQELPQEATLDHIDGLGTICAYS